MSEYEQKVPSSQRSSAMPAGLAAPQAAPGLGRPPPGARLDGLRTALNQSPRTRSLAQLQKATNQSPRVTQLATLAASLQRPAAYVTAQRVEAEEELHDGAETVQRVAMREAAAPGDPAASPPADSRPAPKPNHTGLPDGLKAGIEARSGLSMDDVRVHRNSSKPAQLQALAYAQGTEIHLGPGQERHLPHEAWHVVQQKQGRVRPTLQLKEVGPQNDNQDLTSVAQRMERPSKRIRTEEVHSSAEHSDFDGATDGVEIDGEDQYFYANLGNREVGTLELYSDGEGRYWINNVNVDEDMRRKGIATRLVERALLEHEAIYAAKDMTEHDARGSEDTRYLHDDGRNLVEGLIDQGVLNEDWYFNPIEEISHLEMLEQKKRAEKDESSDSEGEEQNKEEEKTKPEEESEEERRRQEAADKRAIAKGYRISRN